MKELLWNSKKLEKSLWLTLVLGNLLFQSIQIIRNRTLYASDGSFRLISDLISNEQSDYTFNPFNYHLSRLWTDNYRQFLLWVSEGLSTDFKSLILINSIVQLLGLYTLYFLFFQIVKQYKSHVACVILFVPVLILLPVLSLYLDAQIIWAYPIFASHLVLALSPRHDFRTTVIFTFLSLLMTSVHEFSIIYGPFAVLVLLYNLRSKECNILQTIYRLALVIVGFVVSSAVLYSNVGDVSTLGQLKMLGILNISNFQLSSYSFVYIITLILIFLATKTKNLLLISPVFLLSIFILHKSFSATLSMGMPNFWVSYLMRNDFAVFSLCSIFIAFIAVKMKLELKFSANVLMGCLVCVQLVGSIFVYSYTTEYKECWKSTEKYLEEFGFAGVSSVAKFGSCHVDWVAPLTSLIMTSKSEPSYILLNNSSMPDGVVTQEGKIRVADDSQAIYLMYGLRLERNFMDLDLSKLIMNFKLFNQN